MQIYSSQGMCVLSLGLERGDVLSAFSWREIATRFSWWVGLGAALGYDPRASRVQEGECGTAYQHPPVTALRAAFPRIQSSPQGFSALLWFWLSVFSLYIALPLLNTAVPLPAAALPGSSGKTCHLPFLISRMSFRKLGQGELFP